MGDDDLTRLATNLLAARDSAGRAARPTGRDPDFDLERGYRAGHIGHELLTGRGWRAVGRKIGFTNPAVWDQFGVAAPLWAHVYDRTVHFAGAGPLRVSLGGMAAPKLEPEIVVKLRRPLPPGDPSPEELAGCLEWVAVGFEVVDCHYPDWTFTAAEVVADYGFHAALLVGPPWEVGGADPREVAAALPALGVTLSRGDEVVATGTGRNALGSPLLALAHLGKVLAAQPWAPAVAAGEVVTTGTLTPPPPVAPGERWRADVGGAPIPPLGVEFIA